MASSIRKNLAALVISLAFMVISLPVLAAVEKPVVDFTSLKIVTDGIRVPVGLAVDAAGYIYLTDQLKKGVIKFDKTGNVVMFFKTNGIPQRVAIDPLTGNIVVSQGKYVVVYNNNGVEIGRLKNTGGADYEFRFANGVGVHPNGTIYVVDSLDGVVRKFGTDRVVTSLVFGSSFGTSDKLTLPSDLVISDEYISGQRKSRVFVADTSNGRIAIFDDAGVFDRVLCAQSTLPYIAENMLCKVNIPQGIALEYSTSGALSRLYVADAYQSTVTAIDPNIMKVSPSIYGEFLQFIGRNGVNPGDLLVPAGTVYDSSNKRLIIANGYGNLTILPIANGQSPNIIPGGDVPATGDIFTYSLANTNVYEPAVTITGTRSSSAVVVEVKSASALPGATAYAAGTWQCTVSGLASGLNTITLTGSNGAGAVLTRTVEVFYTKSATSLFAIDATPPATDQNSYLFTGKIAINGELTSPTGCTYEALAGSTTQRLWKCSVPLPNEGRNDINFIVAGATNTATINKDTQPPQVDLFALADGTSTSAQVQNITGTVSDQYFKDLSIRLNDGPAQKVDVVKGVLGVGASNGVFSTPVVLSNAGVNTITIEATDEFSHKNTVTRSISFNTAAPEITVTSPADGEVVRGETITVSGTVSPNAVCKVNNTDAGTGATWTSNVALVDGKFNNITIACTQDGKTSSVKRTVYRGSGALELAIADPGQDAVTSAATFSIQGRVDSTAQSLVQTVNGKTSNVTISADKKFIVPVDLASGTAVPLTLSALDGAGNVLGISTRTIIPNTAAPWVTTDASSTTARITGTVEPGSTISVKHIDPTVPLSFSISVDGATYTAVPTLQVDNLFLLQVTATDKAGNARTITAGKPDGDCLNDGQFAQDDAAACLSWVVGTSTPPDAIQKGHCDTAPLINGKPSPDGKIDINDCILSLRRANNLQPTWW